MRIGLTGGIAAGKSEVSRMLGKLGAYILDADEISREVVAVGQDLLLIISEAFEGVIAEDGSLDRRALGEQVFSAPEKLELLNSILHPAIRRTMAERAAERESLYPNDIIVLDVPLLIECGWQDMADEVWLVTASEGMRIKRIMLRDGLSAVQAQSRLDSQMKDEEKAKYANVIIDNSGTLEELEEKVTVLYRAAASKDGKKKEEA